MANIKNSKRIILTILMITIMLSIFVLVLILNIKTPLYKDDYSYSYTFAVKQNKFRITSLNELLDSQINHYKVMNGRIYAHTLAQMFLMFNKSVFNIINAAAFVLLVYLIYRHSVMWSKKCRPFFLITSFYTIFMLTPTFGESYLWLTGACNYLWGILIILVCLMPVEYLLLGKKDKKSKRSKLLALPYFILTFVCGITNENNSSALIVMLLISLLIVSITDKRINAVLTSGFFGAVCGLLVMILAPGQQKRLGLNGGFGKISLWIERFAEISKSFIKYLWPVLAVTAVFLIIGLIKNREKRGLIRIAVLFIGTLASVYSMILSPYFPKRAWSGPVVLATVTMLACVDWVISDIKTVGVKSAASIIGTAMVIFTVITSTQAYTELDAINSADRTRVMKIEAARENGETAIVKSIYGHGRYTCFDEYGDLNKESDTWPNTAIAMYFGVKEVKIE